MIGRFARTAWIIAIATTVLITAFPASAAEKIAIVLMHGKHSTNVPGSPVGQLKSKLDDAGFTVVTPEMPWSRSRVYATTVEAAFKEIDRAVARLRDQGYAKIVIAGHSLGANIALSYAAARPGLTALIAIAPGHVPDAKGWRKRFAPDVAKARAMIAAGKGDDFAYFTDLNQGTSSQVNVTAEAYLSFYDPDGMAAMSKTAPRLKPPTRVLWIIEKQNKDRFTGRVTFSKIPNDVQKQFVVIDSTHMNAPANSADIVIGWLKKL